MNYDELVDYISKDIDLIFRIKTKIENEFEDDKKDFFEIYNTFICSIEKNEGIYYLFEYLEMTYNNIIIKKELRLCDIIFLMHVIGKREDVLLQDLKYLKYKLERNREKIYSFIMKLHKKIEIYNL
jgi:hypothetical protein